ncbi:hypothetical protein L210DRAFT_982867 [Boletus edulis BED1]|uniref:Protein ZIP4 homolog n=1 Tax=Boletus edulis BED1 TaxID=1328754 RepID=A0AAD4C2B2_BOLED|nr:hypothetical protein L210DRAFT_982867 [Boletus edulis BED1]
MVLICKPYTTRSKASHPLSDPFYSQMETFGGAHVESLIKIKPKLSDIHSDDARVVKDLYHITSLAQSFSEQWLKSNKKSHLADALDQEGVNLWNASGLFRQGSDGNCRPIIAALRLAGFRLMEAGLEAKPTVEGLLHILQIACKTGITLSEVGNNESAACVLASAAKYEEALRNMDDPEGQHLHARAQVTIVYFSSRMEVAWRENNEGLATFMADKITGSTPPSMIKLQLALLSMRDREVLVAKLLDIGKSILRACAQSGKPLAEGERAHDALRWLKKAFQIIEPLECSATPELLELKRSVLRSLARGYFLASSQDPENLVRAEAALEEVIATMDTSVVESASSELQQLRWMKLAVVKRRKAGDTVLLPEISASDIELSKPGASVCLTLMWQYGDRHYHASRWVEAVDWFMCGTHAIFSCLGASSLSKCFRKAAMCQLQQKEYARAMATVRRCPQNGATTRYVAFLVAVRQGLEDDATRAVKEMVEAPDFDRRMLLLACRLSHDSDMKGLLLSVLIHLLDTLNFRKNEDSVTESMTLIRCIIRLTLKLLGEPGANVRSLVRTLLNYFKHAKSLVESVKHESATMLIRDISWLWRTAYNCAIDGCSNWENQGEQVSDAFDTARELLEIYISRTLTEVEPSAYLYIANASFAATSGRVILARERISQHDVPTDKSAETLLAEIKGCRARLSDVLSKVPADSQPQVYSFLHVLRVFAVETAARVEDWAYVLATIKVGCIAAENGMEPYSQEQEATRTDDQALVTFEAFCDILWENKACPVNGTDCPLLPNILIHAHSSSPLVLYEALEGILHACLTNSHLSLEKFSRWLRSICTILLSQGTVADRSKAIQYMEQASAVLEEHGNLVENENPLYPVDERLWLLSTAYNTGVECLQCVGPDSASLADEAKRWFECSTVLCRFAPDGKLRAEKISKAYTELLTRYAGPRTRSPA